MALLGSWNTHHITLFTRYATSMRSEVTVKPYTYKKGSERSRSERWILLTLSQLSHTSRDKVTLRISAS